MVRLFVPATAGEMPFAGVVEHIGTSWSVRFRNDEELLEAIRSRLELHRSTVGPNAAANRGDGGAR